MDSARLISIMKTASTLEAISVRSAGRAGAATRSIQGDAFLSKRGRFYATPIGVGSGTGRVCAQAVETSSGPKETAGRKPFVEPQWLLPNSNGASLQEKSDGRSAVQEASTSETRSPSSRKEYQNLSVALYYIVISTSKNDKSSLSEPNAGVLLSLIGGDGNAIMHRISGMDESSRRFQRGAVDVIAVAGPDLGRLAALWIAPEAGTWRLEKASVTILPWSETLISKDRLQRGDVISSVNSEAMKEMAATGIWKGVFHLFQSDEEILGKDAWDGAAQLKPSVIQETSDVADLQEKLLQLSPKLRQSAQGLARMREESMKEYENLKLALLGFSSLLVVAGTASLAALGQGDLAEGFVVGGVGGFLYLLLLQRAVDQLPGSDIVKPQMEVSVSSVKDDKTPEKQVEDREEQNESDSERSGLRRVLSVAPDIGLRGRIALVAGLALVVGRLAGGGAVSTISPPQLLAGVVGFLTSKVAVVLAAVKPTSSPKGK